MNLPSEKQNFIIRMAGVEDAEELLKIYTPYVEKTAISFEYEVPSVEEFCHRIERITEKFPYLVAEENGRITGYAYVSPFIARKAYDWSVETTIYLREDCKGRGYGRALYEKLEEILKKQNVLNMNACIACIDEEDEYLTNASPRFHEHMGYKPVGKFHKSGCKFGRWYDMIWMEKIIGEHMENPPEVIPVTHLKDVI